MKKLVLLLGIILYLVNTIDKFAITRIISQYESFGTNTSSRI